MAMLCGVGMTRFEKRLDVGLKTLAQDAVMEALRDCRTELPVQAAFVANALAGPITGQETIRGHVVLHSMGVHSVPSLMLTLLVRVERRHSV